MDETPFRVYACDPKRVPDEMLRLLGCADEFSLGELLLDVRPKVGDDERVGILYRPEAPGEWLVNPWVGGWG